MQKADEQRRIAERLKAKSRFYDEARKLARIASRVARAPDGSRNFVVCSGGGPSIMEAANRGAAERAGGPTVGLAISLPTEEAPNPFITPDLLFEFHYFFMRKLWFAYLACALVIFPGGFGTMDELFEALTLIQTAKVKRFPVVLYGSEYWGGLLDWIQGTLASEGMVLGAIQVPPSGQPVVLLADHPTTGGYPVIAVVHHDDVWRCAQLSPGEEVRFVRG